MQAYLSLKLLSQLFQPFLPVTEMQTSKCVNVNYDDIIGKKQQLCKIVKTDETPIKANSQCG